MNPQSPSREHSDATTYLSLVIPAYNEAARIGETLDRAVSFLGAQAYASEIIVVDDGSADDTAAVAEARGVRVVRVLPNRGKGNAVREGMWRHASARLRLFSDADGSTPIEEVNKLVAAIEAGADVAIGSRALAGSEVRVHQSWLREWLGRVNNLILRKLGVTRFKDTQCGFKLFTAAACEVVFRLQTVERFSFDAELLYIAERHGFRVVEVPVVWVNSPHSTVNPVTDSARMLWDLLRIRLQALRGRYD